MTMFENLFRSMEPRGQLHAECAACARKAIWSKEQACRTFGPEATPADVRRRLVCADCGKATARVWI